MEFSNKFKLTSSVLSLFLFFSFFSFLLYKFFSYYVSYGIFEALDAIIDLAGIVFLIIVLIFLVIASYINSKALNDTKLHNRLLLALVILSIVSFLAYFSLFFFIHTWWDNLYHSLWLISILAIIFVFILFVANFLVKSIKLLYIELGRFVHTKRNKVLITSLVVLLSFLLGLLFFFILESPTSESYTINNAIFTLENINVDGERKIAFSLSAQQFLRDLGGGPSTIQINQVYINHTLVDNNLTIHAIDYKRGNDPDYIIIEDNLLDNYDELLVTVIIDDEINKLNIDVEENRVKANRDTAILSNLFIGRDEARR